MSAENENSDKYLEGHKEYTKAYIAILQTYDNQIKKSVDNKIKLKNRFFNFILSLMYILIALFVLSVVASLFLFRTMVIKDNSSSGVIAGAITGMISTFSTMLLAIIKLPRIMAKYLFNKNEDKLMNKVIKNIQTYEIDATRTETNGKLDALSQKQMAKNNDNYVEQLPINYTNPGNISQRLDQQEQVQIEQ